MGPFTSRRSLALGVIVAIFALSGVLHFFTPDPYVRIVPPWLPNPLLLVYVSGIAEVFGAIGLLNSATRRPAAWGLILLLVAVFPANVQMLLNARAAGASAYWQLVLWLRLPLQPALIWWVWTVAARRKTVA